MSRRRGHKESEATKAKRRETSAIRKAERERLMEEGLLDLENGLKPLCKYTDAEGQRCMNFAEKGSKFCSHHTRKINKSEPAHRESVLESQLRSEILLSISKWQEKVHYSLLMEWILEGLRRLMLANREN